MAKKEENGLAVVRGLQDKLAGLMDLSITKDDIVAIGVVAHEQRLLEEEEVIDARQKDLNQKKDALVEERAKERAKIQAIVAKEESKKASELLGKMLGKKMSKSEVSVDASVDIESDKLVVSCSLHVSGECSGSMRWKLDRESKEIASLTKEIRDLSREIQACNQSLLEVRSQLQKVDRLDRNARASLAMSILGKTEEGKKLLGDITQSGAAGKMIEAARSARMS